jgi:hypothetical protein
MAERCATPEELEHYVLGILAPPRARGLEQHVTHCGGCAARLQAEALLELKLHEVARARPPLWQVPTGWRPWAGSALPVIAGAALAAVLVLLVNAQPRSRPSSQSPSAAAASSAAPILVACLDPERLAECVSTRRDIGLWVQYPEAVSSVPRYEALAADAERQVMGRFSGL